MIGKGFSIVTTLAGAWCATVRALAGGALITRAANLTLRRRATYSAAYQALHFYLSE